MLGFLAAIVSAPLAAAGALTKGAGDALEIGGGDMPIARSIGSTMSGLGEVMGAGASAINDGIAGAGFTLNGAGVDLGALGRGISNFTSSLNPGSPEVSQSLTRAIESPAVGASMMTHDPAHCDHNDITCPPTPNNKGATVGVGIPG